MEDLEKTLRKKASGYSDEEVTEEYAAEDGNLKLVKRRVVHKNVAPDLSAIKALLDKQEDFEVSEEEIEAELERLKKELKRKL